MTGIIENLFQTQFNSFYEYVFARASSSNSDFSLPNILLNPRDLPKEHHSCWCSLEIENSWVEVIFPKNKVHITHYELTSRIDENFNFPISWKLEATNNNHSWTNLDESLHSNDLSGTGKVVNKAISNKFDYGSSCEQLN